MKPSSRWPVHTYRCDLSCSPLTRDQLYIDPEGGSGSVRMLMTGLLALRSLWFNWENVTAIAETAWWSVPHRPNWKTPLPPEITQQPLYLHLQRLCEWRQNWTERLMLKWDSFPAARTAWLDEGQRAATDNDESRRHGGGYRKLGLSLLRESGRIQHGCSVWTVKFSGSSFPVLPHPCQTLHGPVKRSRANSYPSPPRHYRPFRPAFLSLGSVWCLQVQEPPRRQRSMQRETHQDGGCRFGFLLEKLLKTSIRILKTSSSVEKENRFPDNHMTHS